mmetsp:Transcript_22739/g.32546  ORF Transcript_22739/g.32546 Transcript_22739/m.32546 type:complete len:185 (+) Transcript_22739:224-778(+)
MKVFLVFLVFVNLAIIKLTCADFSEVIASSDSHLSSRKLGRGRGRSRRGRGKRNGWRNNEWGGFKRCSQGNATTIACDAPVACEAKWNIVGIIVCRNCTESNRTKGMCIWANQSRTGDSCGYCPGVNGTACSTRCDLYNRRNGTFSLDGGVLIQKQSRWGRISQRCVSTLKSATKIAKAEYTCV